MVGDCPKYKDACFVAACDTSDEQCLAVYRIFLNRSQVCNTSRGGGDEEGVQGRLS